MTQRETTRVFPVLLLEPNTATAAALASLLDTAGFEVLISGTARSALRAVEETFFFALIVVADLTNKDCLVTLKELRRRAPRSWMIVAAADCGMDDCSLIHRRGGDACVASPISIDDLIHRLDAFRWRARPSF
jgi:DNA-binding response OmpR family regulator